MLRRGQPGIRWLGVFLCLVLGVAFGSVLVTFVAQGAFSGTGTVEGNTMSAAPVDHLSITPASSTVSPSHSQSYTVHALGVSPGNADFGDVTSNTTFTISGSGTCTGSACSATVAGTYTVTAHYWGLTVNATLTVSTAGATKVVFTTQPGSEGNSSAGTELSILPSVTVEDQFGNAVTTDSSTVTLSITTGTPASGGPGNVSACSQSETNGVITFSGCSIDAAGNGYELHAIDGDLTAADSATFDVGTASPAVMITNPNPPSTATAGTIIPATSITAQLLGSSGSNAAAAITFTV
ncbi:MAG TPA: hypothetical protein VG815_04820, partial [Chloroflexota bacterium]|nr:hypothetical protein [Chloroflexota bacterium]